MRPTPRAHATTHANASPRPGSRQGDRRPLLQQLADRPIQRSRLAKIAMQRAPHAAGIKLKNVALFGIGVSDCLDAVAAQAGIELALIGAETGRVAHQCGRDQSSGDHRNQPPASVCVRSRFASRGILIASSALAWGISRNGRSRRWSCFIEYIRLSAATSNCSASSPSSG